MRSSLSAFVLASCLALTGAWRASAVDRVRDDQPSRAARAQKSTSQKSGSDPKGAGKKGVKTSAKGRRTSGPVPQSTRGSKETGGRKSDDDGFVWGLVKKGDTFDTFARRHRSTTGQIRKLNRLQRSLKLVVGARLKVRGKDAVPASDPRPRGKSDRETHDGDWVVHKVRKGDSLAQIAGKYDVSPKDITRLNGLGRRPKLRPGATLKVKRRPEQLLLGGVTLPVNDRLYLRTRSEASWGTPGTVSLLHQSYAAFMALHPTSVRGVIADISRSGGGYFPPHKSHRRGVDADVGYFKINNEPLRYLEVVTPETIDIQKTWDLIRVFINTGHVTAIFMDIRLQAVLYDHLAKLGYDNDLLDALIQYPRGLGEKGGIIRHSPGHHHHLHVRFDCTDPAAPCAQAAVALIPDAPRSIARLSPGTGREPGPPRSAAEILRARAQLHVIEGDEDDTDTEIDLGDGGSDYHDPDRTVIDTEGRLLHRLVLDTSEDSDWNDPDLTGPGLCARPEERPSPMARFGCTGDDQDEE